MTAPKPAARAGRTSLWRYLRMARRDLLSAQPDRLYSAKMAEFRAPFLRSFFLGEPELVRRVLIEAPDRFPKSDRVTRGLAPLLGRSVFVTNGATWQAQRRIIDPAFGGGRLKIAFPDILAAARACTDSLSAGVHDVEPVTSRAAADIIFRTLFSRPIDDALAARTFNAFRAFQRTQPVLTLTALLPWWPFRATRRARLAAQEIRQSLAALVDARLSDASPPDDLAQALMTTPDPETGRSFDREDIIDQVAIFYLAGHETAAAALAWALWLLADNPETQDRVRAEATGFLADPTLAATREMGVTRDVWRETLRLYPPVPMMVREATEAETFRNRQVRPGDQLVISPWHLHRSPRTWDAPDEFRPDRWHTSPPETYLPYSAGPRICPGAGFANTEALVLMAVILSRWRVETVDRPVPVAHLTVRSRDGIRLKLSAVGD